MAIRLKELVERITNLLKNEKYLKYFGLGFALILLVSLELLFFNFTIDDTYISLRYAENFAKGHGIVFNIDEDPTEGYSNFLWILLCSVLIKLGANVVLWVKYIGIVFSICNLFILYKLSKLISGNNKYSFVPSLLLSATPFYALWAIGGLETQMFIFWLLAAVYFFLNKEKSRNLYISSIFFALVALTRPEGAIIFLLTALYFWAKLVYLKKLNKEHLTKYLCWLFIFSIIYIPYFLWRIDYYGYFLPITFYAKNRAAIGCIPFIRQVMSFLYFMPFLVFMLPFFMYMKKAIKTDTNTIYIIFIIISFVAIFINVYNWMPGYRYLVPTIPLIYLLLMQNFVQNGMSFNLIKTLKLLIICFVTSQLLALIYPLIKGFLIFLNNHGMNIAILKAKEKLLIINSTTLPKIYDIIQNHLWLILITFFLLIAAVFIIWKKVGQEIYLKLNKTPTVIILLIFVIYLLSPTVALYQETEGYYNSLENAHVKFGKWLYEYAPKNATIATWDCGAVPYYSKLRTIDTWSLLDEYMAINGPDADYILSKEPDFMVFGVNKTRALEDFNKYHSGNYVIDIYMDPRFENYEYIFNIKFSENYILWVYKNKKINISDEALREFVG